MPAPTAARKLPTINRVHSSVERSAWELFEVGWGATEGGIESYLGRVIERCTEWFEADGVSLFLQLDGSDTFVLAAQSGIDSDLPRSASFRLGESIAGRVALFGEATLLSGPSTDGTAIVAPLETPQSGSLGVLNLSRRATSPAFTREDVRHVLQLARHVALAVSNARLFARLNSAIERHRALAAQMANIVQSLHVGVLVLDSGGRVIEANREALRLLRSRTKGVGMKWDALCKRIPASARPAVERCVSAASSGKRRKDSASGEDGKHFTISAGPVPGGGVTLVIEDVSKQVEGERELARVRRLAEIGQMTAAIAHEIRNPLTSIRGAAQVLREESSVEKARGWAKVIEQEAIALNGLCDQFLEFARPLTLNPRPTDVSAILRRILLLSEPEMKAHRIRLTFKQDRETPIIQADADKLAQAVRNLIRNAMDAMPKGGRLRVETEYGAGKLAIVVRDNGTGISDENLPRLFTPFFTTKPWGTGLGLCSTMRIAEAHGGTVAVERLKKGTSFRLEIPAKTVRWPS